MTPAVPVLTAVTDSAWEAEFVRACEEQALGVTVVRRCVELADLLAAAAAGLARAALLSGDLRRLDRDALARLAAAGVAVVGVAGGADEDAAGQLRRLGVLTVVPTGAPPDAAAQAVRDAVAAVAERRVPTAATDAREAPAVTPAGRVLAVWGPTGAPGRTTVAVNLAAELALLGEPCLLVDADTYGGSVAQVLGLLDEAPALLAAARLANAGRLDAAALAGLARTVAPGLRVLTGTARAGRWPEVREPAFAALLDLTRLLARWVVVDCGFCLEEDDAGRNAVARAALAAASEVVAVGAADPVGLARLVRGLGDARALAPDARFRVVANRVRPAVVGGGDPLAEVGRALARHAGVTGVTGVPDDRPAYDGALATGRTLAEAAPASPARLALATLAAGVADRPSQVVVRRTWRKWQFSSAM